MFKNFIAPIQHWLLKRGQCVGCGMPLHQGKKIEKNGLMLVQCNCNRIFVKEKNRYRRALFEEI